MPTKEVEIKIKAKEETGNALGAAKEKVEGFIHSVKSTKNILKEGFGVGLAAEGLALGMDKIGESVERFSTKMKASRDDASVKSGLIESYEQLIPVWGTIERSGHGLIDAFNDMRGAVAEGAGMDEKYVDSLVSTAEYTKRLTERMKENAEAAHAVFESKEQLSLLQARLAGGDEAAKLQLEIDQHKKLAPLIAERIALQQKIADHPSDERSSFLLGQKDAEVANIRKAGEAQRRLIERDTAHQDRSREAEQRRRITGLHEETEQTAEKAFADPREAEALSIAHQTEAAGQAAADRANEASFGKSAEQRKQIQANLMEELTAIEAKGEAERQAFIKKALHENEEEERTHTSQLAAIEGEAAAQDLRNQHRDDEATLLEMRRAHANELEELDHAEKEKIARMRASRDPAMQALADKAQADLDARKAASEKLFQSRLAGETQKQGEHRQEVTDSTANEALQARVGLLQTLGGMGDDLAAKEAQRLGALHETQEKLAAINKELREGVNLTAEQRKNLEAARGLHEQREKDLGDQAKQNRENSLLEAKIGLLRTLGEGGNKLASAEADQLEIKTKAELKLAALRKQLAGETNSENKKALEQAIAIATAQEKLSLANSLNKGGDPRFQGAPGENVGSGIIGYRAAADVRIRYEQFNEQREQIKLLGGLVQTSDSILGLMRTALGHGREPINPTFHTVHHHTAHHQTHVHRGHAKGDEDHPNIPTDQERHHGVRHNQLQF